MNRFEKVHLGLGTRPCNDTRNRERRRSLTGGVACLAGILLLNLPLLGQLTPRQKLTEAYRLERGGQAVVAIPQLQSLLEAKSLDRAGVGKAWNVLGLAFEDRGDFAASRHAFEESIQAYEGVPNLPTDYAMALDDFGELYVATGQLDLALNMMGRALHLYETAQDHTGATRASSDLAGALLSEKKFREAKRNLDRAVKESRLTNGLDDDDLATLASLQGWLARCDGDLPTSVSKYQQSLDLLKRYHGEEHASTGWGYVLLGQVHAESGDLSGSLMEMVKGVAILGHTLNKQDPRFLSAEIAYAHVLDMAGRRSEAQTIRANAEGQLRTFRDTQCVSCTISAKSFR